MEKKKLSHFLVRIDNCINLITNSSSELFIIKGDLQKEIVLEMMNASFENVGIDYRASLYSLSDSFTRDSNWDFDIDYEKSRLKDIFSEEKSDLIDQLFAQEEDKANYYHFTFDRDEEYHLDGKVHDALVAIGFEFMGSDY